MTFSGNGIRNEPGTLPVDMLSSKSHCKAHRQAVIAQGVKISLQSTEAEQFWPCGSCLP